MTATWGDYNPQISTLEKKHTDGGAGITKCVGGPLPKCIRRFEGVDTNCGLGIKHIQAGFPDAPIIRPDVYTNGGREMRHVNEDVWGPNNKRCAISKVQNLFACQNIEWATYPPQDLVWIRMEAREFVRISQMNAWILRIDIRYKNRRTYSGTKSQISDATSDATSECGYSPCEADEGRQNINRQQLYG